MPRGMGATADAVQEPGNDHALRLVGAVDDSQGPPGAPSHPRGREGIDPLDLPVLVVNRFFQPVQVTSARRAFLLLYGGAALALDESGDLHDFPAWRELPVRDKDDGLPIATGSLRVPRVLHLRRYERLRRPAIRLSRKNLMLRDGHQCQYCARTPQVRELNIDHILPRCRGGGDSWENLVTACRVCNLRKGRHTPEEAGMRLLKSPGPPRWSPATQILMATPRPFDEWGPFLKAG